MSDKRKKEIEEEKKKEKREKLYWREKIRRFEESKANLDLKYLLFETVDIEKIQPWFAEILKIVLLCVRTAYANAYDWDNLTSRLYFELARKLRSLNKIVGPTEHEKQKAKMEAFLETLPGEFPEYEAVFGFVRTGSGERLSREEFEAIWSFIESDTFDKFVFDYLHEIWRK
ncbi:MAG: hypothetical protein AB1608_01545 [Thermoproteota archaeon]